MIITNPMQCGFQTKANNGSNHFGSSLGGIMVTGCGISHTSSKTIDLLVSN